MKALTSIQAAGADLLSDGARPVGMSADRPGSLVNLAGWTEKIVV